MARWPVLKDTEVNLERDLKTYKGHIATQKAACLCDITMAHDKILVITNGDLSIDL